MDMSHPCLVESNSVAKDEQFYETVEVEDTKVPFKLNSSVKATVISLKTYSSLKCRPLPPWRKTRTVLLSFSKHKLKPQGEVVLIIQYKNKWKTSNSLLWILRWNLCLVETPALSLVLQKGFIS